MSDQPSSPVPPAAPPSGGGGLGLLLGGLVVLGLLVGVGLHLMSPAEPAASPKDPAAAPEGTPVAEGAPAAESEAAGRVRFETDPPGASLFINGRLVGATPLTLEGLAAGAYGVRLEMDGRQPRTLRMNVDGKAQSFLETMDPLSTGVLVVDISPRGAEVLLDGELMGLTPLTMEHAPAGIHELLIRKTNCAPFSQRIDLKAGDKLEFKDFALEDKVLKMLQGLVANEKARVGHYIDLAHYYFICDELDSSIATFLKAQDLADLPLELPENMDPDERALEQRLRNEDRSRLRKEIEKHKSPSYFGIEKTTLFREKYDRAVTEANERNVTSWAWVEANGGEYLRNGDYARAERLFAEHLEKSPNSPAVTACLMNLLKARVGLRNMRGIAESAGKLLELAGRRADIMFQAGTALSSAKDRVRPGDRQDLLGLAEKALEKAHEAGPTPAFKAEAAFELGNVLLAGHRPEAAAGWYEKSLIEHLPDDVREDRTYCRAEAMLQAGKVDEAEASFQELAKSEHVVTREKAKAALIRVKSMKE
ncbi:MAG: PEGA domain-containing protein [Planctomycetota bacterium]|nr:PEGA domain-containing protein [Planctomycetota bacterium]